MTDQPPEERAEEPTSPTPPEQAPTDLPVTPDSPTVINPPPPPIAAPNEPAGVGFAAIRPVGQPEPPPGPMPPPGPTGYAPGPPQGYVQGPPQGYQGPPAGYQGPPPGYPPPGYGYAPPPPAPRGGPSVVLVGLLTLVIVLAVGVGALFAFGIGPFARPTPTPIARPTSPSTPPATLPPTAAPTGTAVASASVEPTATTPPSETASPLPSGDVEAALLTHIPTPLLDTCSTSPGGARIVAIATCSADGGAIELTYFLYDSQEAMSQTYEGYRGQSEIEPDTGDCSDPSTWPAEAPYDIGGQPAGRWLCTEALGQTTIYWTDDRLNILSQATHTTADHARLVEFWVSDSGPNL